MFRLHPEILKRKGENQFVVLPYEEYEAVREALEDLEDLRDLREAKAISAHLPSTPFATVQKRLRAKERRTKPRRK